MALVRRGGVWWSCLLILQAAMAWPVLAQSRPALNSYFREVWSTRDGLPHNQVHAIAQTPDGYLWFGTWEGLVRYNGLEFELFSRGNVPALRDNGVRSISVASDGGLILGTSRGGVSIVKDGHWSTLGEADGLAQEEIMGAQQDAAGRLWVATESAGVSRLDGKQVRQFRLEDGLPSNATYGLYIDSLGKVWIPTTDGLVHIDGDAVTTFGTTAGLPAGDIFSVVETGDGGYFVGTEHGVYHGVDGRFAPLDPAIPDDAVVSLKLGEQGDLWIGTVNHGLLRLSDLGLESLSSQRGLPHNRVAAMLVDREGSLWAGTSGGLLRLRDAPFATLGLDHGLSDEYVRTVLSARDGHLWIGTARGLNRWDGKSTTRYTLAEGLPGDSILSLLESTNGTLYIGTYANGLLRLRDGRIDNPLTRATGLPSDQIRAMAETADGSLWIGTTRGLMRWRQGKLTRLGLEHGLPREFILALHAASDGSLWVGTANGAARIIDEVVTVIDIRGFNQAQDVFGFHETAKGDIWMATDRGLLRWWQGGIGQVGLAQGLPMDTLFQVVEDDAGFFWASSNRGVLRLSRADAEAVSEQRMPRVEVEQFGEADGMASAQCNGGSGPAATRAPDGSIWIATARGAAQMRPNRLTRFRRTPPPVVIEKLRVNERDMPVQASLTLPPGTRKLEVQFAGLAFQQPRQIRYRYRLDGFDADWVDRGTQRNAQFTNLAPGRYVFRVSAANPGAAWQTREARIELNLLPLWWQRNDLRLLGLLALLAAAVLLVRWRHHQIRVSEQLLRDMVEQRTRDLRRQTDLLLQSDMEKSRLVEQLRLQSEAFEAQAREDGLTGIANRRCMDERLRHAFERSQRGGQPLSFALLDIDLFKRVNDDYSHAAGDAVLKALAMLMRERMRASDCIARWGGEEFALLFPDTDLATARLRCEQLRQAVMALDFSEAAPGLRLTVSIGVAERDGLSHPDRLASRADQKLYEAKAAGRNRVMA